MENHCQVPKDYQPSQHDPCRSLSRPATFIYSPFRGSFTPAMKKSRAEIQREYRRRKRAKEIRPNIPVSKLVKKALVEQAVDGGVPRHEAEEEVKDRKRVASLLAEVHENWARFYLGKIKCY